MRVLFLNPAGILGGAERCLLDMLASIRSHAPDIELHLLACEAGPLVERAHAMAVRTHVLPLPGSVAGMGDTGLRGGALGPALRLAGRIVPAAVASPRYLLALRRSIDVVAPDVVHSNGLKTHLLAAVVRAAGRPLIWHVRDFIGERPLARRLLRAASPRVSRAIAISQAVADDAVRVLANVPVDRVYDAIDTEEFSPGQPVLDLDALAGLPPADGPVVRVGLVASYARWKGQDLFLDAAALVGARPGATQVRFYVVGGPVYRTHASQFAVEELRARATERRLDGRAGFVPFQREPREVYRALDVVVHASTRPEPFGRTIVEAMACARALVVANAGGAAELFKDHHDAVAVTPGDAPALAAAVAALIGDPGRRASLAAAARQSAVSRFSRSRLGAEVVSVYERAASAAMRRARRERVEDMNPEALP